MMKDCRKISAGGKDIYITETHNRVLEAWRLGDRPNIFSLDYHTDTKSAFFAYSYWRADSELKAGRCSDHGERQRELAKEKIRDFRETRITLDRVNDNLRHDEHIDFAAACGIIDRAFVLATGRNSSSSNPRVFIDGSGEYGGQDIIEFSLSSDGDEEGRRFLADTALEDSVLGRAVERAEALNPGFFDNFILDLDCDYFNTKKSLSPGKFEIFRRLVRSCRLITIALEPECVGICSLDGPELNSEYILNGLIALIARCS